MQRTTIGRTMGQMAGFAVLALAALPEAARAQSMGTTTTTVGNMVQAMTSDVWRPFWLLLMGVAFMTGLWLVFTGLVKFRDIGGHGHSGALEGAMRILGGSLLLALPDTIGAGISTFYSTATGHGLNSSLGTVGSVTDCTQSATTNGGALACVAQNVAGNMAPVVTEVVFAMLYLFGAFYIMRAIYEMATSHSSRGHAQAGWGKQLIIGALICNTPYMLTALETTMGIQNGTIMDAGFNSTSNMLAYQSTTGTVLDQYTGLINSLFHIMVMFGVIYACRGIFFLKNAAEGNRQGGGVMQGMTHFIGGVLLANAKWTTCIVLTSLIGSAVGFCS